MSIIPSKVIASCFALTAFAATVIAGIFAGNDLFTVIPRSTLIMLGCWVLGRGIGFLMQQTVTDYIQRYKKQHPLPELEPTEQENIIEVTSDSNPQPEMSLEQVAKIGKAA
ncbi:hypothetical protein [Poriferisphaera sp. WC338]|uniref:hypothetical protein n=1 Tax=Poriferisphaera sp. WC338 TaxID=3425129 RepID=UPI003D819101